MGYQIKTQNGFDFFECASAFQKSIRRGEEETALYFGVELFISGYDEYAWKRLRIICTEDIGLAEPMMPATIHALYVMYCDQKKKKDEEHKPEKIFFIHAILLLVRAKKSRLVDWTNILAFRDHQGSFDVPDYALDKHTRKGKSMKRGWDHFFEEGCKLANHQILPEENDRMAKSMILLKKQTQESEVESDESKQNGKTQNQLELC